MIRGAVLLPAGALLFILAGVATRFTAGPRPAALVWIIGLAVTGAPVVWNTLRGVFAGRLAADLVAMLAIVAALLLGEPLAGLIVVLMPRAVPPTRCASWRMRRRGSRTDSGPGASKTSRWTRSPRATSCWCGRAS
jgi:hypothetical protein